MKEVCSKGDNNFSRGKELGGRCHKEIAKRGRGGTRLRTPSNSGFQPSKRKKKKNGTYSLPAM